MYPDKTSTYKPQNNHSNTHFHMIIGSNIRYKLIRNHFLAGDVPRFGFDEFFIGSIRVFEPSCMGNQGIPGTCGKKCNNQIIMSLIKFTVK